MKLRRTHRTSFVSATAARRPCAEARLGETVWSSAWLNPFTLRAPLEPNVCYFHTFENNLRTTQTFTNYLKDSCSLASDKHFFLKCFPENAFVSNIFPNLSGLFWLL